MTLPKTALLCFSLWIGCTMGLLPPAERSYKILILLPASPQSHRNSFIAVSEALADRGHQVEMLTSLSPFETTRNIIQHKTGLHPDDTEFVADLFVLRDDPTKELDFIESYLVPRARELYTVPIVQDLYKRRKEFDLIIIDMFGNEMAFPFVHEMPFITVATSGVDHAQSAMYGNVLSPSYVSILMDAMEPPMTFYKRFTNFFLHISAPIFYNYLKVLPGVQREISLRFPTLPSLLEIQRNQSLVLINTHFTIDMALPLLPSQVEVGAMHCRPAKALPKDLEDWVAGAGEAGVIYFSLGSITKGMTMPARFRDVFVKAFSKLEERVIWKYEKDLPGISNNVLLKSWLPQQDLLGDPRVKLFISHGGMMGTQEAMYHATPILVLPIFAEQPKNAYNIVGKGIGLSLNWDYITPEIIVDTIKELVSNSSYKNNIENLSKAIRDQPLPPREKAVFWTEYVIRNQGAPRLRSPAANLSWIEFLLLDVIFVQLMLIIIASFILKWLFISLRWCYISLKAKVKRD